MRNRAPLAIAATAVLSLALPAYASAGLEIEVKDLGATGIFDPPVVEGPAASTTGWFSSGGATTNPHNVRQDKNLFNSGAESQSFNYVITPSAGTYPYYCTVHGAPGGVGMSGKLKIKPRLGSAKRASAVIPVEWGEGTNTGDQFDVRYKGPGTDGRYKTWLKNTELGSADFGANNEPARVKPDKNYFFQARSENSANGKGSGFSPALKVSTVE